MKFHSYRKGSRTDWGVAQDNDLLTIEQINCGAILRIADATEKMAQRYDELVRERDCWKQRATDAENLLDVEHRRVAALRGVLKRKKAQEGKPQ